MIRTIKAEYKLPEQTTDEKLEILRLKINEIIEEFEELCSRVDKLESERGKQLE